jgi:aspartate aminotransferase
MTGWRIAYILAAEEMISRIGLIHQHTATCAASASQYAALAAITGEQSCVDIMCRTYRERRDLLMPLLANSKFKAIMPEGTFYLMLDCAGVDRNTATPAEFLLNKFGIASVDGIFYGASSAQYVRLSLTCGENVLRKAAARLCGGEEKASL